MASEICERMQELAQRSEQLHQTHLAYECMLEECLVRTTQALRRLTLVHMLLTVAWLLMLVNATFFRNLWMSTAIFGYLLGVAAYLYFRRPTPGARKEATGDMP